MTINRKQEISKMNLLFIGIAFIETILFYNLATLYAQVRVFAAPLAYDNYNANIFQSTTEVVSSYSSMVAAYHKTWILPSPDYTKSQAYNDFYLLDGIDGNIKANREGTENGTQLVQWPHLGPGNQQLTFPPPSADSDSDTDTDADICMDNDIRLSICSEPEPWEIPSVKQVVGNGSAQSCTEDALRIAASAGGYITFNCGDAPLVISIQSSIQTGSETVIDGGSGDITLDGGGTSQILIASTGSSLSVRNLRFMNGKAPESEEADGIGGAVAGEWRSNVEVRNCIFEDNTAGRGGGAVAVWTGSSLTIVGSTFVGNRSYYGGAVYSLLSPLQIVHSTFSDNDTIDNGWGEGGAIATDGASETPDDAIGGTVEICGVEIRNNHALRSGGGAYIWVYPPDQVVIDRTLVESNEISGSGLGGGMRVSNGEIEIKASSFISDVSDNHGGALYLDCAPSCNIVNTTFYGNEAGSYGGAISSGDTMNINNVTFAKNSAGGHGGALFGGDKFTIHNSIFVDNTAGNPWNQANNCDTTGTGDHVLQWQSMTNDGGGDLCVPDIIIADPLLASDPEENGGPTPTLLPETNSPVLQAGTSCEPMDQRGEQRDEDMCDLGSVELP